MRVPAAILLIAIAVVSGLLSPPDGAWAAPNQFAINVDGEGRGIHGYDPVAYFSVGKAVRGEAAFVHTWKGARWHFASAEHHERFAADPERYAPRIGGFCAVGAVTGKMAEVDPEQWLVIRGRLYLYFNAAVRTIALEDVERSAAEAEAQWSRLVPAANQR